ncbi:hypothetical protein [Pseudarthrobacter sulfonivorans]|uniref:hypothetical protein n=1 Tax=Pseudarthrobacter sulfonivorans TaxID=121292 RepID=UPI002106A97A|nr:hypothetical protein [Pseudarthrobacter sulfonivorans]
MADATSKKSRLGLNATAAVAGTALLLGGGIAVANATLPAGSAGTVTANPTSGDWSTVSLSVMKLHSDMVCPTTGNILEGALIFMSEPGQEIQSAASNTVEAQTVYPFTQDPQYTMSLNPNGTIADDNTLESGFVNGSKAPIADMAAVVEANHTYSIGYVCAVVNDSVTTAKINPVGGKSVASWATLTTDASKKWTISQPVVNTPSPSASPTETAEPSPSASPTATETVEPSPSATATETPSASATATTPAPVATTGKGAAAGGSDIVPLAAGTALVEGTVHAVAAPAGTFVAGETVTGAIHSDPIALTETAVANTDGSVTYVFTVPAGLPAGTHTLVLTGAAGATFEVTGLTVAAASNAPFLADTNWLAASGPAGTAGMAAMVVGGLTLMIVGAGVYLRRRRGSRA